MIAVIDLLSGVAAGIAGSLLGYLAGSYISIRKHRGS